MAPPLYVVRTSNCISLLIYRHRQDERLSWPGWLTYSGRFTHISGHPSDTSRAQDGERTLARDWRYTAEPHSQPEGAVKSPSCSSSTVHTNKSVCEFDIILLKVSVWVANISRCSATACDNLSLNSLRVLDINLFSMSTVQHVKPSFEHTLRWLPAKYTHAFIYSNDNKTITAE